jgi:hypothetical protein
MNIVVIFLLKFSTEMLIRSRNETLTHNNKYIHFTDYKGFTLHKKENPTVEVGVSFYSPSKIIPDSSP